MFFDEIRHKPWMAVPKTIQQYILYSWSGFPSIMWLETDFLIQISIWTHLVDDQVGFCRLASLQQTPPSKLGHHAALMNCNLNPELFHVWLNGHSNTLNPLYRYKSKFHFVPIKIVGRYFENELLLIIQINPNKCQNCVKVNLASQMIALKHQIRLAWILHRSDVSRFLRG